jgi:RNA polymerase sigma-70 factor (ECF subfamily)
MHPSDPPASPPHATDTVATTHWSVVVSAGQSASPNSKRALEALCTTYWSPLYAYIRRRVADVDQAQDLTQAFIAELLEKNIVAAATPDRGRFRAYLITACKHFLSKEWAKSSAQKRGGGRPAIQLDFAAADSTLHIDPASGLTADQIYDRQWAMTLLNQILQRLEAEFDKAGKANQLEALKGFIIGEHSGTTYAQVAAELGMTEGAAKKAASRMRRRYRQLLRDEIAQTVTGPEQVDEEIRNLFGALAL